MSKYYGEHTKGCQCVDCAGGANDGLIERADAELIDTETAHK